MYKFTILTATKDEKSAMLFDDFFQREDISHKLIGNVSNKDSLLSKTLHFFPDIILLDAAFSGSGTFPLIDQIRETYKDCIIILISSNPSVDFLLEAIHKHVSDIIIAPVTEDTLQKTFRQDLMLPTYLSQNSSFFSNSASRQLFIYKDAYSDKLQNQSLSKINESYGTFFRKGFFRGLIVKMDYPSNIMSIFENNHLRDKIILIIRKYLSSLCYDILFDKLSDGVYVLLNYSTSQHEFINTVSREMFSEIKDSLQFLYGVIVTMCISKEYTDVNDFQNIKNEVFDARYFRIHFGTNKILSTSYTDKPQITPEKNLHLHRLLEQAKHNFRILDIPASASSLKQFFLYVKDNNIIYTNEVRLHIRLLIDSLFDLYAKDIDRYTSAADLKHEFIYRVNMAFSFERIQITFLETVTDILTNVSNVIRSQYPRAVADAILFIEKNYQKEVSLSMLADAAGLTPSYFSALFKKETGETLSDYLVRYRLAIAQRLLKESRLCIAEVAASAGYMDVKYFSRLFKKHMSITPSAFRKLTSPQADTKTG
ncbi:hypothetical protein C819_01068 [Lachnospiraceae bacterium 10-1]|nr:hypothetical protein C819_01068 [Lachnospiraceae bacterium 10-1]